MSCESFRLIDTVKLLLWSATGRIRRLYFCFLSKSSYSRLASGFVVARWQHRHSRVNKQAATTAGDIASDWWDFSTWHIRENIRDATRQLRRVGVGDVYWALFSGALRSKSHRLRQLCWKVVRGETIRLQGAAFGPMVDVLNIWCELGGRA